jgi:hypothetical protein
MSPMVAGPGCLIYTGSCQRSAERATERARAAADARKGEVRAERLNARYDAVAGRGRSSGPASRPWPGVELPREGGFRPLVAAGLGLDWLRAVRVGRGRVCIAVCVREVGRAAGRFVVRGAERGTRSFRGRSSRETRRGGSGARRCGVSQYGQTTHRGSIGFSQFSHGSLTRARQLGQRR